MSFLLGFGLFSGAVAVSFREGTYQSNLSPGFSKCPSLWKGGSFYDGFDVETRGQSFLVLDLPKRGLPWQNIWGKMPFIAMSDVQT